MMIKRYFVKPGGYIDSECLSLDPENPHGYTLFEHEEVSGNCRDYRKDGDSLIYDPIPLTLDDKKKLRQAIVDAITVTVSTGKVFDGAEDAQSRMGRAIQAAQIASIPSTTWVLANNVPTVVTLAELQEALVLSMQSMGAVWATPYE